jgi:hypothetical protein
MERRPNWLGRGGPSQLRSRLAARSCAGLDGAGAHRAIMTCAIIGPPSGRRIAEARAIGQHPMHDDGELACQRHLAFFIPLRLAIFIAQLFNAVQPLSGLVRMMWAPS